MRTGETSLLFAYLSPKMSLLSVSFICLFCLSLLSVSFVCLFCPSLLSVSFVCLFCSSLLSVSFVRLFCPSLFSVLFVTMIRAEGQLVGESWIVRHLISPCYTIFTYTSCAKLLSLLLSFLISRVFSFLLIFFVNSFRHIVTTGRRRRQRGFLWRAWVSRTNMAMTMTSPTQWTDSHSN